MYNHNGNVILLWSVFKLNWFYQWVGHLLCGDNFSIRMSEPNLQSHKSNTPIALLHTCNFFFVSFFRAE